MSVSEAQITKFLVEQVKPLRDSVVGDYYRASATLRDGTHLPCVAFCNPARLIDLTIKRFAETTKDDRENRLDSWAFLAGWSTVSIHDIASVALSPYAWPEALLSQIHGETTMGWTSFTAEMKDGKVFTFGTPYDFDFFGLPEHYSFEDIVEIRSGMIVDEHGVEREFSHDWAGECYLNRPFFYCYSELLPQS